VAVTREPAGPSSEADQLLASSHDREFINAMIEWSRDDVRQVYLRVTASLAIAVLFLTQLPFDKLAALHGFDKFCLLSGLAVLVLAASAHFLYLSKVHRSRRGLIECLRQVDSEKEAEPGKRAKTPAEQAASHWLDIWKPWRYAFLGGDGLMAIGAALLAIALVGLLNLPIKKP
jgi:hypothetical protein